MSAKLQTTLEGINKVYTKEDIINLLEKNPKAVYRGLLAIYERQTNDEQVSENTKYHNKVGFTGFDAELLTSFAKQYQKFGSLSNRQFEIAKKRIKKYWKQLLEIANKGKISSKEEVKVTIGKQSPFTYVKEENVAVAEASSLDIHAREIPESHFCPNCNNVVMNDSLNELKSLLSAEGFLEHYVFKGKCDKCGIKVEIFND